MACILFTVVCGPVVLAAQDLNATDCGLHCAFVACRTFERGPLLYSEFEGQVAAPPADGYSIAELVGVIESHGLSASAMRLSGSDIDSLDVPAVIIAYVNSSHFAIVAEADGAGGFTMLDPGTFKVARVKDWDGQGIVVTEAKLDLPESSSFGWVAWACGIAAVILLGLGVRRYHVNAGS